jgi:hypothetical protein
MRPDRVKNNTIECSPTAKYKLFSAVSRWRLREFSLLLILFSLFIALSTDILLAQQINDPDKSLDPKVLRETFDKLAIHRRGNADDGVIIKWDRPVRVTILSQTGINPAFISVIGQSLSEVGRLSGIDIKILPREANFILILSDDIAGELERLRGLLSAIISDQKALEQFIETVRGDDESCAQVLRPGMDNRIQAYLAVISTKLQKNDKAKITNCLVRAIVTGFGLVEETVHVESIYDRSEKKTSLSQYDAEIIKLLYDNTITSGEKRSVVMKKIVPLLHRAGE